MPIDRIGPVAILAEIGRGANSIVYHVVREADGREYTLKVVPLARAGDRKYLRQAEHEHRVARMLDHSCLLRAHCLEVERDWLFRPRQARLLLDHAPGAALDRAAVPPRLDLIRIFECVASAVAHMHSRGVVHADLKPANVVLGPGGRVKVIDYGLAWVGGERKGRVQGTPEYMAPETGARKVVNELTDVYNFGALMYRLAAGRFAPNQPPGAPLSERAHDRLYVPLEAHAPEAPPEFCALVRQCLRFNPAHRPPTMLHVHRVLDRLAREAGPVVGPA